MMMREEDKAEAGHDWRELPWELLKEIAQRLIILKEKIRIRAVCKTWRKGLAQQLPMMFRQSSPFLMLPYCSINNNAGKDADGGCVSQDCRLLLDVAHNQFHHIGFGEGLKDATCRGSAFGWLFMLQRVPVLFNPLTGNQISLPPITTFPEMLDYRPERVGEEYLLQSADGSKVVAGKRYVESHYMERIAMSAEPTAKDCVVLALCDCDQIGRLAFCKPGDNKWTLIPHLNGVGFANIVFCRNNFYALDCGGRVVICDLAIPKLSFLVTEADFTSVNSYLLAGPDNELMLVSRLAGNEKDEAVIFGEDDDDDDEEDAAGVDNGFLIPHVHLVDAAGVDNGFPIPHVHHEEEDDVDGHEEDRASVDNGFPIAVVHGEDVDAHEDDAAAGVFYIRDSDELLRTPRMYWTFDFRVFKLDRDTNQWDQVRNIGDHALFIGTNAPACLSTKDHPSLKSNCIYFTDDNFNAQLRDRHGGHDMGIYHLTDDTVESFCCNNLYKPFLIWPPPVWVSPSIY